MLPEPTLTFTLPSLHDELPLDCRIYHPTKLIAYNAAIVAHPYAPLGGSYDDPVVGIIASTLLRAGFIVGTFNFRCACLAAIAYLPQPTLGDISTEISKVSVQSRLTACRGATSSAGHTSWTSKPEQYDHMSMVGFTTLYIYELARSLPLTPLVLQAGYSYGAMITSHAAPLPDILERFAAPAAGSAAAEVRQRAQQFAMQCKRVHGVPVSPRRLGGCDGHRKRSCERRSFEFRRPGEWRLADRHSIDDNRGRKSVHDFLPRAKTHRRHTSHEIHRVPALGAPVALWPKTEPKLPVPPEFTPLDISEDALRPAYLLVSPLKGVVTSLTTISFLRKATNPVVEEKSERKLVENPCLAVFGDHDVFVAVKRLRQWSAKLMGRPDSRFQYKEVSSAGHLWVEDGVAARLREAVEGFVKDLVKL